MKVLIIGSAGREHAIAWKLSQSPRVTKIYTSPGNAGTAEIGENVETGGDYITELKQFVRENNIEWVVVGPEAPLQDGVIDEFEKIGIKTFGPKKHAAKLEWSKDYAKNFMKRYGIPTAQFETFTNAQEAKEYVQNASFDVVVKADGLAAGKGVIVPKSTKEALRAIDSMLEGNVFGDAGSRVVIEEKLVGDEATLLCFCDGKTIVPMIPSQDHKRIFDGDTGPNTGGMGVYAPTNLVSPSVLARVDEDILDKTLEGLISEGIDYRGILYVGLMIDSLGNPYVIEYNCRFGDPETQVLLPLLDTDLLEIMEGTRVQKLDEMNIVWKNEQACCIIAASRGYPESSSKGDIIEGIDEVEEGMVFHAGTRLKGGQVVTNGGRVLGVTALGDTLDEAIEKAYKEFKKISFEGMQYRTDIGAKAKNYEE